MGASRKRRAAKKEEDDSDRLENVYYDASHPAAYGSVQQLAKATRIPLARVLAWLRKQRTYTIHRAARKRFPTRRYVTRGLDRQWQADLVDMQAYREENQGYRYLLTVIDLFSRYAFARPLMRKTPEEVIAAFESIFKEEQRQPRFLQTDEGLEFEARRVRDYLNKRGIEQFSVKSQYKAAVVERFNRTLKTRMWRAFTHHGNHRWLHLLQPLVKAYNHTEHRMLRTTPAKVSKANETELWLRMYGNLKKPTRRAKFGAGDRVRVSKTKGIFEKGYLPNWSEEIFTVHALDRKYSPITYKIRDHRDRVIEGSFYAYELQKVDDSEQVYTVERIVRTHGKGARKRYLVKWLGYDETSWINQSDFRKLK